MWVGRTKTFLFGKNIKTQLSTLLFGLAGVIIIVLGSLGIKAVLDSGQHAEVVAGTAMRQRVEQFLVESTNATALKNALIFQTVQRKSQNLSQYLQGVLDNPNNFPV